MATKFYVSDFSLSDRVGCRLRARRWNDRLKKCRAIDITPQEIRAFRGIAADLSIMSQHATVRRPMRGEG